MIKIEYKATAIVLAGVLTLIQPAFSQESLQQQNVRLSIELDQWANNCTSPCTLPAKFLEGGAGASFILAAFTFLRLSKSLRVEGAAYCSSACAILVDKLKTFGGAVCVQQGMLLRLHRAFALEPGPDGSRPLLETTPSIGIREVKNWVDSQGGLPEDGTWLILPEVLVSAYYGNC